ncbi:gamma-glutamylcyclotransferase family protein [Alteromonas portus]|uniref:gamma-glutamylcyclotransferase family protein n=1 Tax=Alteromonas portus TaxID=2565549 RepID=UPI003BF78BBC
MQKNENVASVTPNLERLFIYGSLAPHCPNHHIVAHIDGQWQDGTVEGYLIQQGWGAAMGFPGIIISDPTKPKEAVKGMVLASSQLAKNWAMLDDFEGDQYERVIVPVKLDSGHIVNAYIYQIKPSK